MAIVSAFQQLGKSVTLTTSASSNTPTSAIILLTDLGLPQAPQAFRMVNNGASDIWVYFSTTPGSAAFPGAGTTTAGTPQPGWRLKPSIVEVYGVNTWAPNPNNLQIPVSGFWVNMTALGSSQSFDMSPGEGL